MLIFSALVLIRHLWQLKAVVYWHWCLIGAVLLKIIISFCKISYLNEEIRCTESSPSVISPWILSFMATILIQLKKDFLLQNFFFPHFRFLDQLDDTTDMKIRQGDQKTQKSFQKVAQTVAPNMPKYLQQSLI